jgi:hypothetical protein
MRRGGKGVVFGMRTCNARFDEKECAVSLGVKRSNARIGELCMYVPWLWCLASRSMILRTDLRTRLMICNKLASEGGLRGSLQIDFGGQLLFR